VSGFYGGPEPRETFAALIEADRAEILAAFAQGLEELDNPIAHETALRQQAVADGAQIIDDVTTSIRAGRVQVDETHRLISRDIGETKAARGLNTRESMQAAAVFFQVMITFVTRHVVADARSLQLFEVVLLALNESIHSRIGEATTAYSGYLLNRIHEAHLGERRRIARELHDRVGHGLTAAHRQLQLHHMYQDKEPVRATGKIARAEQCIVESMENLRAVTSDLRPQEPMKSLEKALSTYLDSARLDNVDMRLRVAGDETWAPPAVLDESFLIVREAVRNALMHASPTMVVVGVEMTPHELRAWVADDGCGFDESEARASGGLGLWSMRERAALMGGALWVSTRPNGGTNIELLVPLPGYMR
jgi:signal transduction histidine kinase